VDVVSDLLAGVRVLESALLFNGDTVGAHLGDLGADVIKVEAPPAGDYLRYFLGQISPGWSPAHVQINRNKRSLVVDLRSETGKEVFWRLHATADVFVDGNASDAMTKLGVGYEAQRARKPDIVYCQYSGYGATGPYSSIPTHGQMMDALAGAYPMEPDEQGFLHPAPSTGPMRGVDTGGEGTAAGAIHAAFHIAAALVQRALTGTGAYIDISGTEGVLSQAWIAATYALNEHRITDASTMPAQAAGEMTGATYQYYACADDKNMLFCCIEPKFWRNFCCAVDREDLTASNDGSQGGGPVHFGAGEDALRREIQGIIGARPLADWMALAAEHDIPLGPAPRSVIEAAEDPHVAARRMLYTDTHPEAGEYTYVKEAGIVAGQPYRIRYHAPALGEHTRVILDELGYDAAEIDALVAGGAVAERA
jgi:crotonobetainyl-CoA:carnitine CoA-transferase CaiB-like acyl-CoA transferase